MHRNLALTVPAAITESLSKQLVEIEDVISLSVQIGASRKPVGDIITVQVLNRGADEVLRQVRAAVASPEELSISTAELSSIIDPVHGEQVLNDRDEAIWEEVEAGLRHQGRPTPNYAALMALGGVMAAVGLVSDPVPQAIAFIAASIISPGFEPIAAIPMGVVLRRWHVVGRGMRSVLIGYALFILTAGLTMLWLVGAGETSASALINNPEVRNISNPSLKELLVSACGAAAGIVIIAAYRRSVIAGALIALILMPAAALIGSGIALGQSHLALEGLTRFGIDVGFVIVLGLLIFYIKQKIVHRRESLE
ncbi:DUF389 domain-containing protein [Hymenobacter sp. 5516J-16]|uniref:DUF389 domain-containing protein n=1 Tax=Hymenobacter sublimis TaxID=2933777 RepID=A0ABY4J9E0_9BACT|nr:MULTISPECIES: DUF389 domain-containing protein [Hymenobacter]UOQ75762.1 DUF389 domain-containing protein [Hymenobacter sp. 5516J-16]UPL49438.1 DUF389 domain-containing protein [Hymenobacter sublimis]